MINHLTLVQNLRFLVDVLIKQASTVHRLKQPVLNQTITIQLTCYVLHHHVHLSQHQNVINL